MARWKARWTCKDLFCTTWGLRSTVVTRRTEGEQVKQSSLTWSMIHTKFDLINPCCPSIALHGKIGEKTPFIQPLTRFIHSWSQGYRWHKQITYIMTFVYDQSDWEGFMREHTKLTEYKCSWIRPKINNGYWYAQYRYAKNIPIRVRLV